ncbi:MAG TPA: hypothetical protein VF991_00775 [Reyranella sp.]|jgi:L-fucose mutarotase/ribose pyranase (RbsD/FucU family)
MLLGLDPLLSPDLLHALANYPATRGRRFYGDILLTKGVVPPEQRA